MKTLLYVALFGAICVALSEAQGKGGGFGGFGGFGAMAKMMKEKMKKCGDGEMSMEEAEKGRKECWGDIFGDTTEATRRRRGADDQTEQSQGGKGKKRRGKGKGMGMFGMMKDKTCNMVCQWKITGLLDDSGKFSETGMTAMVNKVYPESVRANATEQFKACASESYICSNCA